MTLPFNTADFFDDPNFSDVTIVFSGRRIRCHKIILCTNSNYFRGLCGPGSRFRESDEGQIELKDDDPDAVEAVLRYIYTGSFKPGPDDWRYHLEVSKAANKYLLPQLESRAFRVFAEIANTLTDDHEILSVIDAARECATPDAISLSNTLEHRHCSALLKRNHDYRARVSANQDMIWNLLDGFNYADDVSNMAVLKCSRCQRTVMNEGWYLELELMPECTVWEGYGQEKCNLKVLGYCWMSKGVAEQVNVRLVQQ